MTNLGIAMLIVLVWLVLGVIVRYNLERVHRRRFLSECLADRNFPLKVVVGGGLVFGAMLVGYINGNWTKK